MTSILIDDEPRATKSLTSMLRLTCPDVEVLATFNDPLEGLEQLRTTTPDMLFLDIQMPHMTGFELLEKLGKIKFSVIFTTAYDQYALQALKASAVDYLLKPIDMEELEGAVAKARALRQHLQLPDYAPLEQLFHHLHQAQQPRIAVPNSEGLVFVLVADIIRLESDGNYTTIFLAKGPKMLVSRNIGELEAQLSGHPFCRVHHSHLIHLDHLRRYLRLDGGYAEMSDGSRVEISRRKKDEFLERIAKMSG